MFSQKNLDSKTKTDKIEELYQRIKETNKKYKGVTYKDLLEYIEKIEE
jgi:hypothetical protein